MKLSILTVITLLLFAGAPAFAQIPELERPQVTPPSPEAAELTKYITYPVNLSNGLVQMSIPLYEIVDGDICLDTHYVYDDLGLTRYVLTPEATAATSSDGTFGDSFAQISGLAYVYKYDDKGRCSSKKLPGRSPVLYRYDKGDEPVFTQDGRMREKGEWMFSFRDALGREAVSGIWPSSRTPDVDGTTVIATYTGSASLGGYSVNIQTPAVGVPLSVNYYDGHSFLESLRLSDTDRLALSPDTLSAYGIPVTGSDWLKGLQTGSAIRSVTDPESVTVSVSLCLSF